MINNNKIYYENIYLKELVNWAGLPGNTSAASSSNTRNKFKNKNSKDGNCIDIGKIKNTFIVFYYLKYNFIIKFLENITQEKNNRFIPVRPILRKKFLPDDNNHISEINNITPSLLNSLNTHNTAIGKFIHFN